MRKIFWACLAAGAAVCCAFWAVAYVSQNPDSALGRCALSACHVGAPAAGPAGQTASAEPEDVIPPDPVPVEESPDQPAPPALPAPGSHLPPSVAALIPPIVIHEDEDLNASSGREARAETHVHVDVESFRPQAPAAREAVESKRPVVPMLMPYCTDDANSAPRMPYCTEDEPAAPTEGKVGGEYREFSPVAFWMGFFSAPSQLFGSESVTVDQPVQAAEIAPRTLPGGEETSEPPMPKRAGAADPTDLFSHPHRLQMVRPSEPASDTMEMRPTDWKPYSLEPGPF